jgi:hypothetical protein
MKFRNMNNPKKHSNQVKLISLTPSEIILRWRCYCTGGIMKQLVLMFVMFGSLQAQVYPNWFLNQGQVRCRTKIVSVINSPSLYRDSAISVAFRKSCELLAKYTNVKVIGGQAFWTTEAGVSSMGAHYEEDYDSSLAERYEEKLAVLDYFVDQQKLIVLAGDTSLCSIDDKVKEKILVTKLKQPQWVEDLPDDNGYYYGVGTSEEYYYEPSSWERAEHNAFMALARTAHSTVQSMQKKNSVESQDVFNEDVDVTLQNIEIAARWRDVKKKIFYVLGRVKH